jgi:hypothetical protein
MDSLIFHIEADKADINMLESIRAFFGNRRIQVLVKPETLTMDDLQEKVRQNRTSEVAYVFEGDSFSKIADQLLNDEPVDLQPYKQTNH